jgi:hypothetical protein
MQFSSWFSIIFFAVSCLLAVILAMLLPLRRASLLLSMTMCCTKLPTNPSDMLSSDGGVEVDNSFDWLHPPLK